MSQWIRGTMKGSAAAILPLGLLLLAALIWTPPALAQQDQEEQGDDDVLAAVEERPDTETVDRILEEEALALAGEGYSYEPGDRRDPFRSLMRGAETDDAGPVEEGIPTLRIDEIDLTGIFMTGTGAVAQIYSASQGKSYLLREGDELRDGDVVSIGPEEIVFKQVVTSHTELKPFREVVKKLNPLAGR